MPLDMVNSQTKDISVISFSYKRDDTTLGSNMRCPNRSPAWRRTFPWQRTNIPKKFPSPDFNVQQRSGPSKPNQFIPTPAPLGPARSPVPSLGNGGHRGTSRSGLCGVLRFLLTAMRSNRTGSRSIRMPSKDYYHWCLLAKSAPLVLVP